MCQSQQGELIWESTTDVCAIAVVASPHSGSLTAMACPCAGHALSATNAR